MIEPQEWMRVVLDRLDRALGSRFVYLGLQGSYRRGEATETSDIDLVAVLDELTLDGLDAYREVVASMPEGGKACGFICGRATLASWPRHEVFQLALDTVDYRGALADLLPPITRDDIREGVRIGAAGLHHLLAHTYLYSEPAGRVEVLRSAFKSAFFILRIVNYLRTGQVCETKRKLFDKLEGSEKAIMAGGMCLDAPAGNRSERDAYELLLLWSGDVMRNV